MITLTSWTQTVEIKTFHNNSQYQRQLRQFNAHKTVIIIIIIIIILIIVLKSVLCSVQTFLCHHPH